MISFMRITAAYKTWRLNRQLKQHMQLYSYGYCHRPQDGRVIRPVRYNHKTKRFQFILWEAGQQGHKENFWHDLAYGWELYFILEIGRNVP